MALTSLTPTPISFTVGAGVTATRFTAIKVGKMVYIAGMCGVSAQKGYPDPILTLDDYEFNDTLDIPIVPYTSGATSQCGLALVNSGKFVVNTNLIVGVSYTFNFWARLK